MVQQIDENSLVPENTEMVPQQPGNVDVVILVMSYKRRTAAQIIT